MAKLLLNAATVSTTPSLKVTVGVQPYNKDTLDLTRAEHQGNYFVKRGGKDGDSIIDVPLKAGLPPLGTSTEEQELEKAPWLLAPLTIEALTTLFETVQRPILNGVRCASCQHNPTTCFRCIIACLPGCSGA